MVIQEIALLVCLFEPKACVFSPCSGANRVLGLFTCIGYTDGGDRHDVPFRERTVTPQSVDTSDKAIRIASYEVPCEYCLLCFTWFSIDPLVCVALT